MLISSQKEQKTTKNLLTLAGIFSGAGKTDGFGKSATGPGTFSRPGLGFLRPDGAVNKHGSVRASRSQLALSHQPKSVFLPSIKLEKLGSISVKASAFVKLSGMDRQTLWPVLLAPPSSFFHTARAFNG